MEMHLIHIFGGICKGLRKISLTDENVFLLSISPPCFHFSYVSVPRFLSFFFFSSICPPFHSFPLFLHFSIPLLHPFLCSFIYHPLLSTQSSIDFSLSEHYRAVRVSGVPVSSTGQAMNLSPLWSSVTRSSFITQFSGGRTEWDGDRSMQV